MMSSGLPATSIIPPDQSSFYSALPSPSSFRLLHFQHVSSGADNLVCDLEVYEIGNAPRYRALSYTWGQPYYSKSRDDDTELPAFTAFNYSISCNGRLFRITKNLFQALSTLVHLLKLEYFWVDAICINQADSRDERPQQISLMGRIYTSATEVLLWLGHYVNQSEHFLWSATVFADAVKRVVAEHGAAFVINQYLTDPRIHNALALADPIMHLREAMDFHGKCRVFDRAWILPELVNAGQIRMFCGCLEIPWDKLYWLAELSGNALLGFHLDGGEAITPFMRAQFCRALLSRRRLRETWSNLQGSREDDPFDKRSKSQSLFAMLVLAVDHLRVFRVSDPRDHIFAALSFRIIDDHNSANPMVTANYTAPLEEIFTSFTINALRLLPELSILWYLEHSEERLQTSWPSWVPDWRYRRRVSPISLRAFACDIAYNVWEGFESNAAIRSATLGIEVRRKRLTVTAVPVTCIEAVVERREDSFYAYLLRLFDLCRPLPGLYEIYGQRPQSRIEALWRTMVLNSSRDGGSPPPHEWQSCFDGLVAMTLGNQLRQSDTSPARDEIRHAVAQLASEFKNECSLGELSSLADFETIVAISAQSAGEKQPKYSQEELEWFQVSCDRGQRFIATYRDTGVSRQLFQGQNGVLGQASPLATPGDQIWLMKGLNVPMVLRPTETQDEFKIVGECYLHGCMNGELFRSGALDIPSAKPIMII